MGSELQNFLRARKALKKWALKKEAVIPGGAAAGMPPTGMPSSGPPMGGYPPMDPAMMGMPPAGGGGVPPLDLMALLGLGGAPPPDAPIPPPPEPPPTDTATEEPTETGAKEKTEERKISISMVYAELVKVRKLLVGIYRQTGLVIPEDVLSDEEILAPGLFPSKPPKPKESTTPSSTTPPPEPLPEGPPGGEITSIRDVITQPTGEIPGVGGAPSIPPVQPIS